MSATIHQLSGNVQRARLLQNALDTNAACLFILRLRFEHLDCFGHDGVAIAFETVSKAMRESVRRDRELYEGNDTEAQIERLKYLARVDAWRGADKLDTCQMLRFPSDKIVRRLKKKRGPLKQTDLPLPRGARVAEQQIGERE
ncbi:hypothetical protein [Xanthomonas medicagonis]|uniref:hypothetical protein n=1 Tax=Xanthomonas medicagonis TaxID=3160841 RepID=UPI0035195285